MFDCQTFYMLQSIEILQRQLIAFSEVTTIHELQVFKCRQAIEEIGERFQVSDGGEIKYKSLNIGSL